MAALLHKSRSFIACLLALLDGLLDAPPCERKSRDTEADDSLRHGCVEIALSDESASECLQCVAHDGEEKLGSHYALLSSLAIKVMIAERIEVAAWVLSEAGACVAPTIAS